MRVAVLGLGSIGMRHARNLLSLGAEVVGFDPDPGRRALLAEAGGRGGDDRATILGAAEAAVIASPNRFHLADLREVVARRLPCLVEKPLAHTEAGLDDLLAEAEAAGVLVAASLNMRLHPGIELVRRRLAAGVWGRPLWARLHFSDWLPSWRPHQDHRQGYTADPRTGGILFDDIHEIDLANRLLGPCRVVAALAGNSGLLGIAAEDIADVLLLGAGSCQILVHMDYASRPRRRTVEIACVAARVDLDLDARRLTVVDGGGAVLEQQVFPGSTAEDFLALDRSFLDALATGAPPPCTGREALGVLRQVLAARRFAGLPEEA